MEKDKAEISAESNAPVYPPRVEEELADLYENLEEIHENVKLELEERGLTAADLGITCDTCDESKNDKQPLIQPDNLALPIDLVRKVIIKVTEELKAVVADNKKQGLEDFAQSIENNDLNMDELLNSFFSQKSENKEVDSSPNTAGISFDLFFQIMLFTLRPFFSWLKEKTQNEEQTEQNWRQNTCPVCGAMPELSRLTHEEGRRILFCWLCSNEWRFERFTCLYCGESQAESQKYFVVENRPYRVDICQDCGRYLKVIDERRLPEMKADMLNWLINDLGTDHLDSLAQEEGYTRI